MSLVAELRVSMGMSITQIKTETASYEITLDSKSQNVLGLGPSYPELQPGSIPEDSFAKGGRRDG